VDRDASARIAPVPPSMLGKKRILK